MWEKMNTLDVLELLRAHVSTQELTVTSLRRTDEKGRDNNKHLMCLLDSSRTVHAVLSNNCSTLHWSDKTHTIHTVSTKTTHSWTWLGRSLTSLKQILKHHQLLPNNYTRQLVYLRTFKKKKLCADFKKSKGGKIIEKIKNQKTFAFSFSFFFFL